MIPDNRNCYYNPNFDGGLSKRFKILVREHDPNEEPGWKYKLEVYDYQYLDADRLPVYSIAAGDSWEEAFATAAKFVEGALAHPGECVFI